MITMNLTLEGGSQLQARLDAMVTRVARGTVRKAVRAAQQLVMEACKTSANAIGGAMGPLMASLFTIKTPKRRQEKGSYSLHVLFRKGTAKRAGYEEKGLVYEAKDGKRTFIPAAIEYGHGRNKEQAAMPFMRTAAESSRQKAFARFADVLRQGLEAAARG